MTGVQLARRMGVTPPRIVEMEKDELAGSLTLRSLQKAAEALGCEFVYALVPKAGSLEETVRIRARDILSRRMGRVSHTMRLEDQGLPVEEEARMLARQVEEAVRQSPKWLWD